MGEDGVIGFRVQGEFVIIVLNHEAPFLQTQSDFLILQDLVIGSAQNGLEHPPFQKLIGRMPIHIKKYGIGGGRAVFQDVQPPGVVMAQGHVIGNDVEEQSHIVRFQGPGQGMKRDLGAEFRVNFQVAGHRVAVQAPASGPEKGRGVNIRDS